MKTKKRLNLGCGRDYKKGWVNVEANKNLKADKYFDLRKKFPLPSSSFDYILASDVLEHFTKEDANDFLDECWRVLKRNGVIEIRTHNVFQIFQNFRDDPEVLFKFLYGDTSEEADLGLHKYAYTDKSIVRTLKISDFKILKIKRETTNYICLAKKITKRNRKIKLLISLQDSGGLGGAENFILSLAEALRKKKIIVEFTSWNRSKVKNIIEKKGFKVRPIPIRMDIISNFRGLVKFFLFLPLTFFVDWNILKKFIHQNGDYIFLTGVSDKILLSPIARLLGLKVIWIEYSSLEPVFKKNYYIPKILYRVVKNLAEVVIVPTVYSKSYLIPQTRISESKIVIIPCGIEIPKNRIKDVKHKSNRKIIGVVSRLERGKGQDLLIKSVSNLKAKNFKLLIVGEGEELNRLRRLVKKLKMEEKVEFRGYVDNVYDELFKFDVFVFPSTWELEGFGIVPLEAMAAGVPVIACDYGPIPEVIGDAGYLVNPNKKDLTNAINSVLKDTKLQKTLIRKGFLRVKKFDINKIADDYISNLKKI